MNSGDVRIMGSHLLAEARALRAAFPDADAVCEVRISGLPPAPPGGADEAGPRAALGYLRDEMLLVQAGKAADLTVLDDEIAGVERLLGSI